jgi:hypothetical protein
MQYRFSGLRIFRFQTAQLHANPGGHLIGRLWLTLEAELFLRTVENVPNYRCLGVTLSCHGWAFTKNAGSGPEQSYVLSHAP